MNLYTNKPVQLTAMQLTQDNFAAFSDWVIANGGQLMATPAEPGVAPERVDVMTSGLMGRQYVQYTDYVTIDGLGRFGVMSKDDFELHYKPVEG